MPSLKRPAASVAVSLGNNKKQKIAKSIKKKQIRSKQTDLMEDIINTVGSQSTDSDEHIDHNTEDAENSSSHSDLTINDSFSADAIQACNNLRAVIVNLTSVINQQQTKITSIELQLANIVSTLQTISDAQQSQCQCQKSIGRIEEQQAWHPVQGKHSNRRTNNVYVNKNNVTSDEKDDGDGDAHFTMIVHRTLGDVSRRKRNIIVSGLPEEEESGADDRQTFLEFCSAFLPIKPSLLDGNCCSRIGKASPHRPRKLLVRLNSEESATNLLRAASSLRHATDDYVKTHVFINADLSPSAAKLAYESRKRRREMKLHVTMDTEVESMERMNDGNISSGSDLNRKSTGTSANVISAQNAMSFNDVSAADPVVTVIPSGATLAAPNPNAHASDSSTAAAASASADRSLVSSDSQQATRTQPFQ